MAGITFLKICRVSKSLLRKSTVTCLATCAVTCRKLKKLKITLYKVR